MSSVRELTPDEQLRLNQLKELIEAGLATENNKIEYRVLSMASDDW